MSNDSISMYDPDRSSWKVRRTDLDRLDPPVTIAAATITTAPDVIEVGEITELEAVLRAIAEANHTSSDMAEWMRQVAEAVLAGEDWRAI